MTQVATKPYLGILPLRDHRPRRTVRLDSRDVVYAVRSEGWHRQTGDSQLYDHGDLNHAFYWPAANAKRPGGDAQPATDQSIFRSLFGGSMAMPGPGGGAVERKIGQWAFAVPAVVEDGGKVRPTLKRGDPDWRFRERYLDHRDGDSFVWPAGGVQPPVGTPGIVLVGSDEEAQRHIFFPSASGLVAHHEGLTPAEFSTRCYDIAADGTRHPGLNAGIHSAWRVKYVPTVVIGGGVEDDDTAVCWNLAPSTDQEDGRYGYGPFVSIAPGSGTGSPHAIGLASSLANGPLAVGHHMDKHRHGINHVGEPMNAGHLSTGAYWFANQIKDAPEEFRSENYEEAKQGNFWVETQLRYDPGSVHGFARGPRKGLWRWETYALFRPPETPPEIPTRRPPPTTEKPPPTTENPPGRTPGRTPEPDRSGRGQGRGPDAVGRGPRPGEDRRGANAVGEGGRGGQPGRPDPGGGGAAPGRGPRAEGERGRKRRWAAGIVDPGEVVGVGQQRRGVWGGIQGIARKDIRGAGGGANQPDFGVGGSMRPDRGVGAGQGPFRAGIQGVDPGEQIGAGQRIGFRGGIVDPETGERVEVDAGVGADSDPGAGVQPQVGFLFGGGPGPAITFPVRAYANPGPLRVSPAATPNEIGGPGFRFRPQSVGGQRLDLRWLARAPGDDLRQWDEVPWVGGFEGFGLERAGSFARSAEPWQSRYGRGGTGRGGAAFLPGALGLEHVLSSGATTTPETVEESYLACIRSRFAVARTVNLATGRPETGWYLEAESTGDACWTRLAGTTGRFCIEGEIAIELGGQRVILTHAATATRTITIPDETGTLMTAGGRIRGRVRHVTTTPVTLDGDEFFVWCDTVTAGAAIALTLPATSAANHGQRMAILNAVAGMGSGNVSLTARDTQGVNEAKTLTPGLGAEVCSDNTDGAWYWLD